MQEQSMYWTNAGAAGLTYTVRYQNGYIAAKSLSFYPARPPVTLIEANFDPDGIQFYSILNAGWFLTLGRESSSPFNALQGITVAAQVETRGMVGADGQAVVGADGQSTFVQLVNTTRSITNADGTYAYFKTTIGTFQLDTRVPYGGDDATFPSNTSQVSTFSDLPGLGGMLDGHTRTSIFDDFKLFLMYRPDGPDSIWVTLREIDWGWSATASHPAGTTWNQTQNPFESTPTKRGPTVIDTAALPTWLYVVSSSQGQ